MKQLKHKLTKVVKRRKSEPEQPIGRITNETVAEHREQILAGGRRYKYPRQYAKHKLVINTIIISAAALLLLVLVGWWQLYPAQNTSRFMYQATRIIPVPIGQIDGKMVRYSDYLMRLRSELHYLERESAVNLNSADGKRQKVYQKRIALNKVQDAAYIEKLADERNIEVTDKEIDDFVNQQLTSRQPAVSREEYEKIIKDYYDWSFSEYEAFIHEQLLRRKVALAVDEKARTKVNSLQAQLQGGADFAEVAKSQSEDELTKANGGDVGFVSKTNDDPQGLIAAAQRLQVNQVSGVIETPTGYYLIKLLETNDSQVRYARILIGLHELDTLLKQVRDQNKVSEYIDVPKDVTPTRQQ